MSIVNPLNGAPVYAQNWSRYNLDPYFKYRYVSPRFHWLLLFRITFDHLMSLFTLADEIAWNVTVFPVIFSKWLTNKTLLQICHNSYVNSQRTHLSLSHVFITKADSLASNGADYSLLYIVNQESSIKSSLDPNSATGFSLLAKSYLWQPFCCQDRNIVVGWLARHKIQFGQSYFQGPDSIWRSCLTSIGNTIVEIRRS